MPTRYQIISTKDIADPTALLLKTGGSLSGALNEAKGTDIASATTCDIGAATGNYVVVTGTTTITGLGTVQAGTRRIVTFSGALILTYNATSLILPTAANITTAAGDTATFISLGSGNWVCTNYQRKDGTALVGGGSLPIVYQRTTNFTGSGDITGLSFTAEANKKYRVTFAGYLTGGTTATSILLYLPTDATLSSYPSVIPTTISQMAAETTAETVANNYVTGDTSYAVSLLSRDSMTGINIFLDAIIEVTTGGTIKLNVTDTITLYAGAFMTVQEVTI